MEKLNTLAGRLTQQSLNTLGSREQHGSNKINLSLQYYLYQQTLHTNGREGIKNEEK